jgi:hypothetical protein
MITVNLHCRGREPVMRKFTALPAVGCFIDLAGELWIVDAVTFRESAATWGEARPTVYAVAVGSNRGNELQTAWDNWGSIPGKD